MSETFYYGQLGTEDINKGLGTFSTVLPNGSTATLNKVGIHDFVGKVFSAEAAGVTEGGSASANWTALQNLINNYIDPSEGGSIYLPSYTVSLSAALTMTSRKISFAGVGSEYSVLYWPSTGIDGINPASGCRFKGLTLRGPNSLSSGFSGIDSGGTTGIYLEDVIIEKWGSHGLNTGGSSSGWKFVNCIFQDNHEDGVLVAQGSNNMEFHNCDFLNNAKIGLDINGIKNRIFGGRVYSNGGSGGAVDAAGCYVQSTSASFPASNNIFHGVDFSENAGPGLTIRSLAGTVSNDNIVIGCRSDGNTGSGSNGDGFNVDMSTAGNKDRNKFIGCMARSNQRYGILVGGGAGTAEDNEIFHCTALSNGTGQVVDTGTRTRIAGNLETTADASYFIKNILQVLGAALSVGTTPATSGTIRIPNGGNIVAWDGSANRQLLALTSSQTVLRGGGGVKSLLFQSSTDVEILNLSEALKATFAGLIQSVASTTSSSGLNLPHGTAPTSPVNGDVWTTTAGLFVRINGVTVGPLS